jgi:peptidoglycan/LPS O-acetylase OafA/YrhL
MTNNPEQNTKMTSSETLTQTPNLDEARSRRSFLVSTGAVIAGLLAVIILSNGTDAVLHATGVYPPWFQPMADGLFLLATAYRIVFAIAGSYIAARLAPSRPMLHALILGGIGFVLALLGAIATWNAGPQFGPRWYPLALVVTALPCAWVGGKLREKQLQRPR